MGSGFPAPRFDSCSTAFPESRGFDSSLAQSVEFLRLRRNNLDGLATAGDIRPGTGKGRCFLQECRRIKGRKNEIIAELYQTQLQRLFLAQFEIETQITRSKVALMHFHCN